MGPNLFLDDCCRRYRDPISHLQCDLSRDKKAVFDERMMVKALLQKLCQEGLFTGLTYSVTQVITWLNNY